MKDIDLFGMICDFESHHGEIVKSWQSEIEQVEGQGHIVKILDDARVNMQENLFYFIKFLWILFRYNDKNHSLLRNYLNRRINNSSETSLNAGKSLKCIFDYLAETKRLGPNSIKEFQFENILNNDGKAKEINQCILNSINANDYKSNSLHARERSFADFLISDCKMEFSEWLREEFSGKKGKHISIMILALEQTEKIAYSNLKELIESIERDFGYVGSYQSINDYVTPFKTGTKRNSKTILSEKDIAPYINKIKAFSCK